MALKELYDAFIGDNDFWKRIAGACMVAALNITAEDPGTVNHADRLQWAISVRDNVKGIARSREVLVSVLQDATISADVEAATDVQIQTVVNSLIDTWAG